MSEKIIKIPEEALGDLIKQSFDLLNKKEGPPYWQVEDMAIGDYIVVQIINKEGDRNLDGGIIKGKITELVPSYKMVRLESGWCCHTKDKLLEHRKVE